MPDIESFEPKIKIKLSYSLLINNFLEFLLGLKFEIKILIWDNNLEITFNSNAKISFQSRPEYLTEITLSPYTIVQCSKASTHPV